MSFVLSLTLIYIYIYIYIYNVISNYNIKVTPTSSICEKPPVHTKKLKSYKFFIINRLS